MMIKIWKNLKEFLFSFKENSYPEVTPGSGSSDNFGKDKVINFIEKTFPSKDIKILDVGPGRGIYNFLLKEKGYQFIDAVEIYLPYIKVFELKKIYSHVFNQNIVDFKYDFYHLIILGDVLEHLNITQAKKVINYAQKHSKLIIVAVPYLSPQKGCQLDGSGDHKQADLTRKVFLKRYKNFHLLKDNKKVGIFYFFKK